MRTRGTATWIFAAAIIAAALAFTLWQRADEDADRTGDDPDRASAYVALAVAGIAAVCGTVIYVNTDDDPPT